MSYSNSNVAHMWAHQTKCSANGSSFFFEGRDIYSYGYHYICGCIKDVDGSPVYFINDESYSPSTGKHQSCTRRAVPGDANIINCNMCEYTEHRLYPAFDSESSIETIINVILSDYINRYAEFAKMMIKARSSHEFEHMYIIDAFQNAIRVLGKHIKFADVKNAVKKCEIKKIDRAAHILYGWIKNECNGNVFAEFFEAVNGFAFDSKKMEEYMRKQREVKQRKAAKELHDNIVDLDGWHKFENYSWYPCQSFVDKNGWHTALRVDVKRGIIESSKGIRISVDDNARLIWLYIKALHNGKQFTHNLIADWNGSQWKVNSFENDVLTAGCHKIPYSECEQIAKACGWA